MDQPTKWKTLKRHPASAEYPDVPKEVMDRMVENLKENGIIGGRKVILYEKRVFDAWQFYQACIKANVKPRFEPIPRGVDPAIYLETVQDLRRHETQETAMLRAAKRRERVATARAEGQSTRAIAETENVSHTTIEKDLEKAAKTGLSVIPPGGQVTGLDGKKRPATTDSSISTSNGLPVTNVKPRILCPSCQTRARKSQPPEPKCRECRTLRAAAKAAKKGNQDADIADEPAKAAPMDKLGNELPKSLRDTFAGNSQALEDSVKLLFEVRSTCKKLTKWNPYLRANELETALTKLAVDLTNGVPHCICESCSGKGCKTCRNAGWMPKWRLLEAAK